MQRLLVVLVVIAALAGGAAAALSDGGPNAQLVHQDRLYGGGTDPGCFVPDIGFCRTFSTDFSVDAHATDSGHAAYGDVLFGANHIQVTCLAVDGNKAAVGGIITSSANPASNGNLGLFFFVDGGPPNTHLDQVSPLWSGPPRSERLASRVPERLSLAGHRRPGVRDLRQLHPGDARRHRHPGRPRNRTRPLKATEGSSPSDGPLLSA